jgi:DNA uptake protein ComE-like DNA-binding protein
MDDRNKALLKQNQDQKYKASKKEKKQLKELEYKLPDETKKLNIKKGYYSFKENPIFKCPDKLSQERIEMVYESFKDSLTDEKYTLDTIDRVFKELITSAYIDRGVLYSQMQKEISYDGLNKLQAIRQKADNHLIQLIKSFMDTKKSPIKVLVRNVDQLNVSDKQVNINQKNANDLDKNYEEIS